MGEALLNLSKYEEANKYEEAAINFDLSVKKGLDNYYNNYNKL
ncbi:hypothetical protein [Brachyspira hampsonii]|nr:hypothetical protein [Brachyspira hampsonii]